MKTNYEFTIKFNDLPAQDQEKLATEIIEALNIYHEPCEGMTLVKDKVYFGTRASYDMLTGTKNEQKIAYWNYEFKAKKVI